MIKERTILILVFLFAQLSFQLCLAEKIQFETATRYKKNSDINFIEAKAGDMIELSAGDTLMALSKQGLPVLIFSAKSDTNTILVKDTNFSQLLSEEIQPIINKTVSEIVDGTRKAEALIQKRDYQQALTVILPLKNKYKNISSVLFLSGTIHFLLNNKTTAVEDLEKGLQLDPDNTQAKNLISKLKAGAQ